MLPIHAGGKSLGIFHSKGFSLDRIEIMNMRILINILIDCGCYWFCNECNLNYDYTGSVLPKAEWKVVAAKIARQV